MEQIWLYISRIAIAVSVLFNVLFGGYSNQTFSARNWDFKRRKLPNLVWLIDFIAYRVFGDKDHCMNAWIYWYVRKHLRKPH